MQGPVEGGTLNTGRPAVFSWPLFLTYVAAAIGGLVLVIGLVRFNALHQEFLGANFDSVHGARTLLKSRFLIDQAARDIEMALVAPERRAQLLQAADKRLFNAEHYSAEGKDGDPTARQKLVERIRAARHELLLFPSGGKSTGATMQATIADLQRLARDVDAAELDRWGTLSGLNNELAARMRTQNQLIGAAFVLFVGVMLALAWALLRTRSAEAALLAAKTEAEAIQQTTLDASPIGIAYVDTADPANRRIHAANRQMAVIFGFAPEMMPGLSVRRLFAGDDNYARFAAAAPERLARGEVLRDEVVMQRRNGVPFWCALSAKAIDPADLGRGVVWTCEDISERKAVEAALHQERVRAEAASQAKSEFLANMSHELRTPFTGLFGLLDLLRQSPLDANQRRHLDLARSSAAQMQAIVNDILDFSKIEAGKLIIDQAPFNLRALATAIADVHATAAEQKGLRFTMDTVEPLAAGLVGDTVRIRQIVDNLLSNAIKFTEYGEIRLTIRSEADSDDAATLRITVEDTGIGIAADKQPHIFDKFTQADSSTTRIYGGSGLGLAISKQLATLMGGQITLSSSEGRGSRFSLVLRLPVASLPTAADAADAASDAMAPAGRLDDVVVLLVEDNPVNRSMLAETLEMHGAVVYTAENGEEAVRLVGERRPNIVLMDCQMPLVDGFEATRRIRAAEAAGEHLPIIAVSAFATSSCRDQCLAPGMMDRFLPKPLDTGELIAAIRGLLTAAPERRPGPGRILLVDDNALIREATCGLIANFGYEVATANDGNEALALLEAGAADAGQAFDLVLMDCNMPGLDGWETVRRWRQREHELARPPLAIIAVTADDGTETRDRCCAAGMDGTLLKPFDDTALQALLADWLG
jgi:two-component system, sensor histidine kinase and response regulator